MNIHVCSRDTVVDFINNKISDPKRILVISIVDPPPDVIDFPVSEDRILRLSFHDLEEDYPSNHITLFNLYMANQIKLFVLSAQNIDDIIVHCEAGISRSAAVAAALSQHFLGDCSEFFADASRFIPNKLVFKTLLDHLNGRDNEVPKQKLKINLDMENKDV